MKQIRIWSDELARLPEYSCSQPSGVCDGKTWKRRTIEGWMIGRYSLVQDTFYTHWFEPVLLSGPRRENESVRFKTQCERGELPSMFPAHGGAS